MAATSENTAFPNLGYETTYFVGPGEIVRLRANGMEQLRKPNKKMQICSFLWIYYGFPTSSYEGKNVEEVRFETGRVMGEEDDTEVDSVGGIPDSGIGMAVGYSAGHHTSYQRGISKYTPTWPRSFMPPSQEVRNLVAKMKLIPVHEMIEGKKILLLDDSIVRGTQLKEKVEFLYESGAKEVHVRSACPPIMFGCKYLNFSRSNSDLELIARRVICEEEGENIPMDVLYDYCDPDSDRYANMIEKIRVKQHYTSLRYNRLDDLLDSVGIDKDKLCTYCWNGKE
jgi:amidophosphoribosyltransferase